MPGKRRADPGKQALGGRSPAITPQYEHEFVPANAGSDVRLAAPCLQDARYLPEHGIPGAVAGRAVDALKIVNIHNAE